MNIVLYIGFFLSTYVVSVVLLVTLKTILEKKGINNIKDNKFDNYFLILMTIYNLICLAIYLYK